MEENDTMVIKYKKHFCEGENMWKPVCAECIYTKEEIIEKQKNRNKYITIRFTTLKTLKTHIVNLKKEKQFYKNILRITLEANIVLLENTVRKIEKSKSRNGGGSK